MDYPAWRSPRVARQAAATSQFESVREQIKPLVSNFENTPLQDNLKLALDQASQASPNKAAVRDALVVSLKEFVAAYSAIDPIMLANLRIGCQVSTINSFIPFLSTPELKQDMSARVAQAGMELTGIIAANSDAFVKDGTIQVLSKLIAVGMEPDALSKEIDNIIKFYSDKLK